MVVQVLLKTQLQKAAAFFKNGIGDYHFLIFWTLLNLFQVATTELTSDEGYYWFYSTRLEWGYYDHPPMVAFLIWAGRQLFSGELGVRFFNVIAISVGILFMLKTVPTRQKKLFYLILLATPLFNYITFFVFPDTALVAFSGIALYAYQKFIEKNNLTWSLVLAFSFAFMLYSKYHAVLFIFFIILSNLKLLLNKYFIMTLLLTLLLFFPHLWWQYLNGFPSFIFHLIGRNDPFKINNLFEYLSQQLVIIGLGLIWIPFVVKAEDSYTKALKYISTGTLVFFALSTIKGFVHLHWTSIALFPILILASSFYASKNKKLLLRITILPFLVLILILRLYLSFKIIPVNKLSVDYYHGRKLWSEDIHTLAGKKTVVFESGNSGMREAPLYSFYSHGTGIPLLLGEKKKSQYHLWNYEDSIQGEPILLIRNTEFDSSNTLKTRMGRVIHYREIDCLNSFNNIHIECAPDSVRVEKQKIVFPLTLFNHRSHAMCFGSRQELYVELRAEDGKVFMAKQSFTILDTIEAKSRVQIDFIFEPRPEPTGRFTFVAGFNDPVIGLSVNSTRKKLHIK
jgi:hypothetical protein